MHDYKPRIAKSLSKVSKLNVGCWWIVFTFLLWCPSSNNAELARLCRPSSSANLDFSFPSKTQCAAVMTYEGAMSVPPQSRWLLYKMATLISVLELNKHISSLIEALYVYQYHSKLTSYLPWYRITSCLHAANDSWAKGHTTRTFSWHYWIFVLIVVNTCHSNWAFVLYFNLKCPRI